MQQIESYLILERITKDIYAEYGFEQFTIHDSIGTRECNLKTLESAFKKRFFAETGIVPSIDIQDWGKEEEQLQRKAS